MLTVFFKLNQKRELLLAKNTTLLSAGCNRFVQTECQTQVRDFTKWKHEWVEIQFLTHWLYLILFFTRPYLPIEYRDLFFSSEVIFMTCQAYIWISFSLLFTWMYFYFYNSFEIHLICLLWEKLILDLCSNYILQQNKEPIFCIKSNIIWIVKWNSLRCESIFCNSK